MTSHPFAGTIYGLGHTINNYQIKQNEYALIDSSSDSKNYGVGLFASLSGRLYDINIKNVKVSGKNFVGGVVGRLFEGQVLACTYNGKEKNTIG